jgi:hypothetical protein
MKSRWLFVVAGLRAGGLLEPVVVVPAHALAVARAQDPEIRSDGSKLEFVVPTNANVTVVYRNPDGTESAPAPIAMRSELETMRSQMQALSVRSASNMSILQQEPFVIDVRGADVRRGSVDYRSVGALGFFR